MHFVLSFPSEHYKEVVEGGKDGEFQCTSCFHSPPNITVDDRSLRQSMFQCTSCFHSPPNTKDVSNGTASASFNALRAFIPLRTLCPPGQKPPNIVSMHFVLSFPSELHVIPHPIHDSLFQCTSCFHSPPNFFLAIAASILQEFQCTSCFHSPPNWSRVTD